MAFDIIEENEFYTIKIHPEHHIVHHEFHQYVYGDGFRACLLRGLEVMKTRGATKWLSDDRQNAAMNKADAKWAQSIWWPQAIATGWQFWAIVSPETTVGKMSMNRITKSEAIQNQLVVRKFESPEPALNWLISQSLHLPNLSSSPEN